MIITGGQQQKVIVRAIELSLAPFGVGFVRADPILEMHDQTGALIAANDNWSVTRNRLRSKRPAFRRRTSWNQRSSEHWPWRLHRGGERKDGGAGTALVEVYDLNSTSNSTLANIKLRGAVSAEVKT